MRRRLAICVLAMIALLGCAVAEGALCVNAPGLCAFVDEAGNDLAPGVAFDSAFPVRDGALYALGVNGAYRLYDAAGNALGARTFSMIHDEGDCLIFRDGERYGAMDAEGRVVVEPEWTQLSSDGMGGWLALSGDPLDEVADALIHLDAAGEARPTGVMVANGLQPVCCDRMPYMSQQGKYGAVDGAGDAAVPAEWNWIGPFEDGLAVAWGIGGAGLIDAAGREVIPAAYGWLRRAPSMIAAQTDDRLDVFAPDGRTRVFTVEGEGIEAALIDHCLWVVREGLSTLYGPEGAVLAEGDAALRFAPGLRGQLIAMDGAWGETCQWLMDPDGGTASGRFQQILPLCADRYAWLVMDGATYYSEELGDLQRSWNYDSARYGLMDRSGTPLTDAAYREIIAVGEDRLALVSDGLVRLADLNGAVLREWVTAEGEAPSGEAAP